MKMLTKTIEAKVPKLYSGEKLTDATRLIPVKYFSILSDWRWYVLEGEQKDGDWRFFGLVTSPFVPEGELGYFMLSELESAKHNKYGFPLIERDMHWDPTTTLADVKEKRRF